MRSILCFHFILIAFSGLSQDSITTPFASKIIAYSGFDFKIPKANNTVIVQKHNIRFKEDSLNYIIRGGKDDAYIIIGTLFNSDTINKTRYDFLFINIPDPRLRLRINDNPYPRPSNLVHRDSLDQLKDIYCSISERFKILTQWEILSGTVYVPNLKGRAPTFEGTKLSDEAISRFKELGDTIQFSVTARVRGADGVTRQIGGSYQVLVMEGEKYERYVDPNYDFKRFSDTVYITPKQFKKADTLYFVNPGHLYIGLPKQKTEYEVDLDDGIGYNYYVPNTIIPAGKGYYIYDAYSTTEPRTLEIYEGEEKREIYIVIEPKVKLPPLPPE